MRGDAAYLHNHIVVGDLARTILALDHHGLWLDLQHLRVKERGQLASRDQFGDRVFVLLFHPEETALAI